MIAKKICLLFLPLILGVIYVSCNLSPSSYGFYLQSLKNVANLDVNDGVIIGTPRGIRSDEWAVVTSLTKALTHNNFERINKTSIYQEDFRTNFGLPINDWGLIFKPTMWGFKFLSPAKAFSLHWYLITLLFIWGYFLLFRFLDFGLLWALGLVTLLFCSGFVQFWWTEKGPTFALFPWLLLAIFRVKSKYFSALALFYITTSWTLTNFYPPLQVSLGFVGAVLVFAYKKINFQNVFIYLTAVAVSSLVSFVYLYDYLIVTAKTIYPGSRSVSGGGLPISEWMSQVFPFSTFYSNFETISSSTNICEVGAVGSFLILFLICNISCKDTLYNLQKSEDKRVVLFLFVAWFLMSIWMLVPISNQIGKIFLWSQVQPGRMKYAEGFLLLLISAFVLKHATLKLSFTRFLVFSSLILVYFAGTKGINIRSIRHEYYDLFPIMVFGILLALWKIFPSINHKLAILSAAAFINSFVFLRFNPLQSTEVIFHDDPKIINYFSNYKLKSNIVVYPGNALLAFGATLNGLGFQSVTHVTPAPQLTFWRTFFPELSESEFNSIFNRFSHIQLTNNLKPSTPSADVVLVPISKFINYLVIPSGMLTKQTPLVLKKNIRMHGKINKKIKISRIGILIGNYHNTSQGMAKIHVCTIKACTSFILDYSKTQDNQINYFTLDRAIECRSNELLTISINPILNDKYNPIALWVGISGEQFIFHIEGADAALHPKIVFWDT